MSLDEELLSPSRELIASLDIAIKKSEAEAVDKIKRYADDDKIMPTSFGMIIC